MLTPTFQLSQDEQFVYLAIRAPHARLVDSEVDFGGKDFKFYAHPYYLRLHLPKEVCENGQESATWDGDKQSFEVKLPKKTQGEHFEGLDMLTQLLTVPKSQRAGKTVAVPGIEVISSSEDATKSGATDMDDISTSDTNTQDEEEEFDWHFEQSVWSEQDDQALLGGQKYGFGNKYTGVFKRLGDEASLVIDLEAPDSKSQAERTRERLAAELGQFDEDHYLADLYEQNEVMDAILQFKPFHARIDGQPDILSGKLSESEIFCMKNLPRKDFLLDKQEKRQLLLGLLDILYAYCYDMRSNEGEHSVESGWTICKLSATLSWLEAFERHANLRDVLISSIRRSFCYPLYRSWQLAMTVLNDLKLLISSGRLAVLKCFLGLHGLLNESGDSRYLLNDLYITDYCVWLQRVKESTFADLAKALEGINIAKAEVGLDLELLEKAAQLAIEEKQISEEKENESSKLDGGSNIVVGLENLCLAANGDKEETPS